jgi:hypothetical protein
LDYPAIETRYDSLGEFYCYVEDFHDKLQDEEIWYDYDRDTLLEQLHDHGVDRATGELGQEETDPAFPDVYRESEPDGETTEWYFLGKDEEHGHGHFYRFTPEFAEVILTKYNDAEEFMVEQQYRLRHGDPRDRVRRYAAQNLDSHTNVKHHDFRSLAEPTYDPELNTQFDGSILLDDARYTVPLRAPFSTVTQILESAAEENDAVFVDYRPEFVELASQDTLEKYQLVPELRGNTRATGTRILDEVLILDRGSEDLLSRTQVDELLEDSFVEDLSALPMFDRSLAEQWIDTYRNHRTGSWATTGDIENVENTWDLDAEAVRTALQSHGLYQEADDRLAGRLHVPEHREFDTETLVDDPVFEETVESSQSGLTDF